MKTAPGGGRVGRNPDASAPVKAANSEIAGVEPTTPTPPTSAPFLNKGTPPGLTAVGSLSVKSGFPVVMPRPMVEPSTERDGGTAWPGAKFTLSGQPRLVFSTP